MEIRPGTWFVHVKYGGDREEMHYFLDIEEGYTSDKLLKEIEQDLGTFTFVIDTMTFLS